MQEFIKFITTSILSNEEDITVEKVKSGEESAYEDIYEVNCREEEKGKLIGKHGKTIMAIRDIVNAVAIKNRKKKVRIRIVD